MVRGGVGIPPMVRWLVYLLLVICGRAAAAAELRADLQYAVADGQVLKLDASVPDGQGPFPVAILVHGGGWCDGDKAEVHVPPRTLLTDARFTWFSIDYRLAPQYRWPACIDDLRQAIRWVKAHAAEYKGDPGQIALIGYSAGGHLATYAAVTADQDTRVQAVVGLAAPTDLEADCDRRGQVSPALQNLFGCGPEITDEVRAQLRATSPLNHLHAGLPPFLLIHGTEDQSVPYGQSVHFKSRLEELGVPCELVTIEGAPHNIREWGSRDADYEQKMVGWLLRVLAGK
jgi:acetyl esterase/lipase